MWKEYVHYNGQALRFFKPIELEQSSKIYKWIKYISGEATNGVLLDKLSKPNVLISYFCILDKCNVANINDIFFMIIIQIDIDIR